MVRKRDASSLPGTRVRTLEWKGGVRGHLSLLEQTLLPAEEKYIKIRRLDEAIAAIRRLAVRGAPAIGCAAAYSFVLGLRESEATTARAFERDLSRVREELAASRPTAVNLFWALDRMVSVARGCDFESMGSRKILARLLEEALEIHEEDRALCRAIGKHGAKLLRKGQGIMTHCNAGALATGGMGTALSVIYCAAAAGKAPRVYANETRPLLQGARLTSWELQKEGIDVTVICDNAAATVFAQGKIDAVVVGADRIARNGDVANKIGTHGVAILAKHHRVPFYVAAPSTTFDRAVRRGADIPIEIRSPEEISSGCGRRTVPRGVAAYNPAFDVTPARLVSGIITERGVLRPPFAGKISALIRSVES